MGTPEGILLFPFRTPHSCKPLSNITESARTGLRERGVNEPLYFEILLLTVQSLFSFFGVKLGCM